MHSVEIKKDIFWVGAVDWNMRTFHGHTYTTKRGTTYNAYLILDNKITLVDAVYGQFTDELIAKIRQITAVEKIDYIVINHVETDHTGALPEILKLCPKAKIFCSAKSKEALSKHYSNWDFQVVKTNDKLNLGKRTLTFIEAPMIHWPDSMFTYCIQEQLLLPNDAFGQHYATSERFDDETDECALMDEAEKYYANILWPFSSVILKKIEEIQKMNIPINMIAPSHGIIWRKDPLKIINTYTSWSKNESKPKAVIVYETMWGATAKMARTIAEGITDTGLGVKIFDITQSDRTEVIKEMFEAKGYLIGSSTHNNGMLPTLAGFLGFLKGSKPKNRVAAIFGSYGWAGGAEKEIENVLKETDIEIIQPNFTIKYAPNEEELKKAWEFGRDFALQIKNI
jgi:anaerobic nitric oxide reductase flavorubredoxin